MFTGGDSKNLGQVWPLQAQTFSDFVERHLNIASVLNSTRKAFSKADKETRNKLKRSPFVTPAYFGDEPCKRLHKNIEEIALVCIDIDDPKQAAPYVNNESLIEEMIGEYNFALYTTASSTPDDPRARVIVEANLDLDLEDYSAAVLTLAKKLGLPEVTDESFVPGQPMYLPILFADDDPDLAHPLISFKTSGRCFESHDVDGTAERAQKKRSKKGGLEDAIEFLKAPVESVTLKTAEEMLEKIDPDIGYLEWLNVCLALRHQFYGKQEDKGYKLFDTWSQAGEKYSSAKDTRAKWDSCNPHAASRYPVTIRTLMKMAEDAGWDSGKTVQDSIDSALDFIAGLKTPRDVLSKGIKKIALVPMLSAAEDDLLLNATHQELKDMSYKVSIPALRAELKKCRTILKFDKKENGMPSWAKGLVYITSANEFFRPQTGERLKPEPLDNAYSRHLMGDDESATRSDVRPRDLLLNQIKIPVVYDYAYNPAEPNETIVTRDKKKFVNTYIRSYPDPDFRRLDEAAELIEEHTANLFKEQKYRNIFLDWCAYQVQYPGRKIRWAPLIQGGHGCGKSFYHNLLEAVLGFGNAAEVGPKQLVESQYNEWADGSQLVTFEEIRLSGHNRHEVMDRLKPIISNSTVSINEKYRNLRQVPNVTNYMALTNHHDAAILTDEDRRWFVLKCKPQTKAEVLKLGAKKDGEYFDILFSLTEGKKASAARAYFENREISPSFNPRGHAPRTCYFDEMVAMTKSSEEEWIADFLENSSHKLIGRALVSVRDLTSLMELEGLDTSSRRLSAALSNLGYKKANRVTIDAERHSLYLAAGLSVNDSSEIAMALEAEEMSHDEVFSVF